MATVAEPEVEVNVAELCVELQRLQKRRAWFLKSKIMINNRLGATVAGTIGYHTNMTKEEKKKVIAEAHKLIKGVAKGTMTTTIDDIVIPTSSTIDCFKKEMKVLEKIMVAEVAKLHVIDWVNEPEQRGFGPLFLAIIIGETGDLFNYENPGKVWRRLGCAPYTKDGVTMMGASWRGKKEDPKMHKSDWQEFGYSPRRRSIAYLLGASLLKMNHSIYRERYDNGRKVFQGKHPEYVKPGRSHNHGMLVASKLLLKNLWLEWHKGTDKIHVPEYN